MYLDLPPQKKPRIDHQTESDTQDARQDTTIKVAAMTGREESSCDSSVRKKPEAPSTMGRLKTPDDSNGSEKSNSNEAKAEEKLDEKHTFPERLMYLLQNETDSDALWWQPDGDSFAFEPKLFTEKVLSKLPGGKIKFESFIRKLNRWYVSKD